MNEIKKKKNHNGICIFNNTYDFLHSGTFLAHDIFFLDELYGLEPLINGSKEFCWSGKLPAYIYK
jgi:hypothetical protein